jgi:hypothetical protein
MNKHFLSRRQFNALCASVGLSVPTAGTIGVLSSTSVFAADAPTRTVKLRNGAVVPAVGQGSWHLGQGRHPRCLRTTQQPQFRFTISRGSAGASE